MRTLPSPCKKGYDGSRLKISMAILPLFLNEPTCFNLTANMVMVLNWKGELSIQFSKLIGQFCSAEYLLSTETP